MTWLIGKYSDAGRDWGQEEKGRPRMRWLDGIRLNGRESEWTPGFGDGQGGLACYDSRGRKESDMTEWLNWTELNCERSWNQSLPSLPSWLFFRKSVLKEKKKCLIQDFNNSHRIISLLENMSSNRRKLIIWQYKPNLSNHGYNLMKLLKRL